ncbi:MAG: outer membrane protein assembly factor BamB [Candidatus Methylumidiphilus sp.]
MRLLLILLCAALLNACAGLDAASEAWTGLTENFTGKDSSEPPRELADDFEPKIKLSVQWSVSVGDGDGGQNLNLTPAVDEDNVIAADYNGILQARSRQTGEKRWEVETEIAVSSGPVLSNDKAIVGGLNGEIAAFALTDGALLWKTSISSAALALPDVGGGVVVVRGSDGRVTALDERSGITLWRHDHNAPLLAMRSKGGPVIVGDKVIDGFGGGKLAALDVKTGKTEWEALVALPRGRSEIDRLVDINAVPVVKDDMLYVSGYHGGIAAVALRNGEVQWRQEKLFTYSGLSNSGRALFIADADSDVWRLDMRGANDLWKQSDLHQRRLTQPIPVKDTLVLGDLEGYVHVLSQDDGSLLARVQVDDSPIEAAPVVFGDIVYVYTSDGTLAALTVE